MENKYMKFRLSVLMFLQVGVFGILSPVMSLYLIKTLGFSQGQAGTILAISGITTFLSPIIGIFIADKLMSVERLLGLCHFLAAIFMLILAYQKSYQMVILMYLLYMLVLGCTSGFTTSIVFQHDPDPKKNFGFIRMWGSIGWVVPGWFFSYIWLNKANETIALGRLGDILIVASVASLLLAVYTFTLPKSKVDMTGKKSMLPVDAIVILKNKQVILMLIAILIMYTSYQFYLFGMAPFLEQSGYNVSDIMPLMSITQIVEVVALGLLGLFLIRTSYKRVIIIGVIFNIVRYVALAMGASLPFILIGVVGQGLSFVFFFNVACIYLDSKCNEKTRSDMQQIIGIVANGFGVFLGNLIAGLSAERFINTATEQTQYSSFWLIPIILNVVVLIGLAVFFKEEKGIL